MFLIVCWRQIEDLQSQIDLQENEVAKLQSCIEFEGRLWISAISKSILFQPPHLFQAQFDWVFRLGHFQYHLFD
jgi:hypothetical protein